MTIEQELKDKCTPEFIKWMCEYAEGFELFYDEGLQIIDLNDDEFYIEDNTFLNNFSQFPLLIYRAVEGWNNNESTPFIIEVFSHMVRYNEKLFRVKNYQPESLTQAECAMLHCLLDIFSEQEERDERI